RRVLFRSAPDGGDTHREGASAPLNAGHRASSTNPPRPSGPARRVPAHASTRSRRPGRPKPPPAEIGEGPSPPASETRTTHPRPSRRASPLTGAPGAGRAALGGPSGTARGTTVTGAAGVGAPDDAAPALAPRLRPDGRPGCVPGRVGEALLHHPVDDGAGGRRVRERIDVRGDLHPRSPQTADQPGDAGTQRIRA